MEYIFMLLTGAVLIVLAIQNFKGNISTIHSYNRRKVTKENAPKYGRAMGLGTLIMGGSIAATAVLRMIFDCEAVFYLLAAGIAVGLVVMVYAQFKYNRGIF